ncbi:unnamed protein product [Danaus chrysippus]|uniref:(African queen) hypothetical protein n=1 Tax=Danaus chrysippus TaxID=151541 RepID=A0A8J2VZ90_9NEOP|nr:unnamed protein product [Danaus chrysippus]
MYNKSTSSERIGSRSCVGLGLTYCGREMRTVVDSGELWSGMEDCGRVSCCDSSTPLVRRQLQVLVEPDLYALFSLERVER